MRPSDPVREWPASGPGAALAPFLRLLWNVAPPILALPEAEAEAGGPAPFLSPDGLHLPAPPAGLDSIAARDWSRAAAAHAAAHLVFSRRRFSRAGVAPITQALVDVLEDARVEALAMRALPGLRRLWSQWHTAAPADGEDVPTLLGRLARVLADPAREDSHPWVRKGRALFFLDSAGEVIAPVQGLALRRMASALGHDLGQMRKAFDPRAHRIVPAYRDDNRWLWQADGEARLARPRPSPAPGGGTQEQQHPDAQESPRRAYPEWDARIGRLRQDWCTVRELKLAGCSALASVAPVASAMPGLMDALRYRALAPSRQARRALDGEPFDLDAAIDAAAALRLRLPIDARVHRLPLREPRRCAAWVLVDASASSAAVPPGHARSVLQQSQAAAQALADAMAALGWCVAVQGFCSDGRQDVRHWRVLDPGAPWDDAARTRLQALQPGRSTRLGAAVRHAAQRLAELPAAQRFLWVLGDAQPHDIDIHEPSYLAADARHAVRSARQARVSVGALLVGAEDTAAAQHIFGSGGWALLPGMEALAAALRALRG